MQINTYILLGGNCAAAFEFYAKCLGGEITGRFTYGSSPMQGSFAPDWQDKIMHIRLEAGGMILMGSDAPPDRYEKPQGFSVSVSVPKMEDAERIFHALAENGSVQMPIQKTFWSERFGMLVDQFGIPWMVNCDPAA